MPEYKETIIADVQIDKSHNSDLIGQLERSKKAIIGLKQEQKDLNDNLKKGTITLDEYAKESVRVEQLTKNQTNSYSKLSHELQGTKSFSDKLTQGFANQSASIEKLIPGFGGMVSGIGEVTKASLTFIATPIGAIIAALGLAIAAVTQYFRDNEEGQNQFNELMKISAAVVGRVTDAVSKLGGYIVNSLIKGWELEIKILEKVIPGLKQIIQYTKEQLNLPRAKQIADLEAENDVLLRNLTVKRAELDVLIAQKKLLAENRELNPRERAAALQEAINAQNELNTLDKEYAKNKYDIIRLTNQQSNSTIEDKQKEAEAKAELIRIDQDTANKLKEITIKQQALNAEVIKGAEETRQAKKDAEEYVKTFLDSLDAKEKERDRRSQEAIDTHAMAEQLISDLGINLKAVIDTNKAIEKSNKEVSDAKANNDKAIHIIKKQNLLEEVNITREALAQSISLFKENTAAYKIIASAQAIMDTYRAAAAALAPPPEGAGPIAGPIFAAIAIANGLASVAKINNVKFQNGGVFSQQFAKGGTIGGNRHSQGGTKFYGTDGSMFEAEREENLYVLNRNASKHINALSALNEYYGGVSFKNKTSFAALGGQIQTSFAAQESINLQNTARLMANILQNLPPNIVTVEDINAAQSNRAAVVNRATVL